MKVKLSLFILLTLLLSSCKNSTSPNFENEEFGIYLLKDTLLITSDAKKKSLDYHQLQEKAIIDLDDIVEYDWDEQIILLTADANERFNGVEGKIKSTMGLPYILVAEKQKIYLGNIYPMYSSYYHEDIPSISVAPFTELRIAKAPMNNIEDKRKDERIFNVLRKYKKIK